MTPRRADIDAAGDGLAIAWYDKDDEGRLTARLAFRDSAAASRGRRCCPPGAVRLAIRDLAISGDRAALAWFDERDGQREEVAAGPSGMHDAADALRGAVGDRALTDAPLVFGTICSRTRFEIMAVGWARDGAVQEQIDANVEDAVNSARRRLPAGESLLHCEECGSEIPQARRDALPGVRRCVACQSAIDKADATSRGAGYNRRGNKDSQLR